MSDVFFFKSGKKITMGLPKAVWIVLLCVTVCVTLTRASSAGERKRVRPPLVEEEGRRKLQKQTRKFSSFLFLLA